MSALNFCIKIAQILQALATPAIAIWIGVITSRIQRQQAKIQQQQATTHHLQHRLALMDRRMRVFNAAFEFIVLVIREGKMASLDPVFKLARDTRESYLLFGSEIRDYVNELSDKGIELNTIHALRNPEGVMRPEDVEPFTETLKWFAGQTKSAEQKFLKYIDFREP